jgi:hypothetical protein
LVLVPPQFFDSISMKWNMPVSMALWAPPISGCYVHDTFLEIHVPPPERAQLSIPQTGVCGHDE